MSTDVVSVAANTPVSIVIKQLAGVTTEQDVMGVLSAPKTVTGQVRDYMTKHVVSFGKDDNVIAVCECFVNHPMRRVLIRSGQKLVGIITCRDLIKYILEPISS